MENELVSACRCLDNLMVKLFLLPSIQDLGLLLHELGLHGKLCIGQTQCILVIHPFLLAFSRLTNLSHKTNGCQWPQACKSLDRRREIDELKSDQ
jgi:hypothetical protein